MIDPVCPGSPGEHELVYNDQVYDTDPPTVDSICKNCGGRETRVLFEDDTSGETRNSILLIFQEYVGNQEETYQEISAQFPE